MPLVRVAVDTGGTFTDAVTDDGRVVKVPSTPDDPSLAVAAALRALGLAGPVDLIHGTTVGTNALLTRNLPATGCITNECFDHILLIGRQARPDLYALQPERAWLPLRREHCAGVPGRMDAEGNELEPLDAAECRREGARLVNNGARALAVVLLHAWRDPRHEQLARKALAGLGVPVTVSTDLSAEFREVERGTAALLNAALRPVLGPYLASLAERTTARSRLGIMTSAGGVATPARAALEPVRLLLSGPAGAVVAAAALAARHGIARAFSCDVGGTSTDVAFVEGALPRVPELAIAGHRLRGASLDVQTVGAGGGSIASLDGGGALRVGPESAGACPGPAAFGNGGPVTVTDALLLLGRLPPAFLPAAAERPDEALALAALKPLARRAGLSPRRCAEGIIALAEASMARALRAIGEERGRDPRTAALIPCGGGGALHASALARSLGIRTVLVPPYPGAFSATGLLLAPLTVIKSRTLLQPLRGADVLLARAVKALMRAARTELVAAGASARRMKFHVTADLRYAGQSHELELPFAARLEQAFHRAHRERAGFMDPERAVELVGVRVRAEVALPLPAPWKLPPARRLRAQPVQEVRGLLAREPVSVHDRDLLLAGMELEGPTLIADRTATLHLQHGDHAVVLADSSILVRVGGVQ